MAAEQLTKSSFGVYGCYIQVWCVGCLLWGVCVCVEVTLYNSVRHQERGTALPVVWGPQVLKYRYVAVN